MSGANPCFQNRGGGGGLARALQRVRQADGDFVAFRFGTRQLAQQHDGLVQGALVGRVPGTGQDRERRVDQTAARGRALFEFQGVVVRRQRGGIFAGVGESAGAAGEGGPRLGGDRQDLFERGGRRLGLTQRREQMRIRGERRIGGATAISRRALGPRPKPLAQARPAVTSRELDQASRDLLVVGAFEQRALGALEQRARIGAVDFPVRAGGRRGERDEQGRDQRQTPHPRKIAPPGRPSAGGRAPKKTGPRRRTIATSGAVRGL